MTNHGPLVLELEEKLKNYLGVKHLFFVNNGTVALQIALKALEVVGDVITTPFSYIATTSSILWEGLNPVFADIEPKHLSIDTLEVEKLAKKGIKTLIATHVYGNPCDVEEISRISKKHNMSVIYDAAHAFNVKYKDKSILNYGDISTLSFHATKLFHTIEGGAIITNDDELAHKISYMRNFGHNGTEKFWGVGINGKSSEFNAAMGLSILPEINQIITARKNIFGWYNENLFGLNLETIIVRNDTVYNYAYYPIIFKNEEFLLKSIRALNDYEIFPRRYFYPSLNTLDFLKHQPSPIAEDIASRILCLPLFYDLKEKDVLKICKIIKEIIHD